MTDIDLHEYIRDIPDFPKSGILFRDITPLLKSPKAFNEVLSLFSKKVSDLKVDAIIGIESRGFIFGAPIASSLNVPFIPIRKVGKLPAQKMSVEYSLEYGNSQLDIHADALNSGDRVVIIDDLLATGGTARAASKLVELLLGKVVGFFFVIELLKLDGRKALQPYPVESLVTY